jgi:agarase
MTMSASITMTKTQRTRWGGLLDRIAPATNFFRAGEFDGAWWLIDPDGGRFMSKGVDTVKFDQDQIQSTERVPYAEACARKYGSQEAWRAAAGRRLLSWGFNTLGAWSDAAVAQAAISPPSAGDRRLAVAPILDLGAAFCGHQQAAEPEAAFPDVFHRDFDSHVRRRADELCAPSRDDPAVLGWFIDNELRWGCDWRGSDELLTIFLNLSAASEGRRTAINLLHGRYDSFSAFNAVWRTPAHDWDDLAALRPVVAPYQRQPIYLRDEPAERRADAADPRRAAYVADCAAFAAAVAERYFDVTTRAIRAADPNHMVLGCRFAYVPERGAIDAAGRHCDVISFNCYDRDPLGPIAAYAMTGRPCLIGEFSFRADDSGLPNTNGAAPRVATQAERASGFTSYATAALRRPNVVGFHWFEHADQPREGRFDGENSNYGTVTIDDEVYAELTRAMTALNEDAERIHATAVTAPA